jgi:hypothetical protein
MKAANKSPRTVAGYREAVDLFDGFLLPILAWCLPDEFAGQVRSARILPVGV